MNKLWTTPTIPIGLLGILSPVVVASLTAPSTSVQMSCNELQMSCNELRFRCNELHPQELRSHGIWSCVWRSCKRSCVFPLFSSDSTSFCTQMSCVWAQMSCIPSLFAAKFDITTPICYLYLYFPSHYSIIFRKSQAIWPKKFLKSSKLDNFKSIVCVAALKIA